MTQRQIDAAFRKSLTKTYVGLTAAEKRLVKLHECHEELQKSISRTYQLGELKFGVEFRKHPDFQESFEAIYMWECRIERALASMRKLEEKHSINRDAVLDKFQRLQVGRGYGGSFL